MSKPGSVRIEWNKNYWKNVLKQPGVDNLVKLAAQKALDVAQASAPVDNGDYHESMHLNRREGESRYTWEVEAPDWKALIIESKTGNLARAIKKVKV